MKESCLVVFWREEDFLLPHTVAPPLLPPPTDTLMCVCVCVGADYKDGSQKECRNLGSGNGKRKEEEEEK